MPISNHLRKKKVSKSTKNKGLTLAEVLLALTIVGVVASLTIPNLVNATNNSTYLGALKKNYSTIAQVYTSLQADGVSMEEAFPGTDLGAAALNIIAPKLKIIKNCGLGLGCLYTSPMYYLDGTIEMANTDSNFNANYAKAILADGSIIIMWDYGNHCNQPMGTGPLLNTCGEIYMDINGTKGPNKEGNDFFSFWITKTGIFPWGSNGDGYTCAATDFGCTSIALTQGINYISP